MMMIIIEEKYINTKVRRVQQIRYKDLKPLKTFSRKLNINDSNLFLLKFCKRKNAITWKTAYKNYYSLLESIKVFTDHKNMNRWLKLLKKNNNLICF